MHDFLELPFEGLVPSLPADSFGNLACCCRALASVDLRRRLTEHRGFPIHAPLRLVALLETAKPLSFRWSCGGGLEASGDAGWGSETGHVRICPPDSEKRVVEQYSWELEITQLDGLLCVGISDHRFLGNCMLTASTGAWGLEINARQRGGVVSANNGVESQVDIAAHGLSTMALRPVAGNIRIIIGFILDFDTSRLKYYIRRQAAPGVAWTWHFLPSTPITSAHYAGGMLVERLPLSPTVSTNIGAAVKIISRSDLLADFRSEANLHLSRVQPNLHTSTGDKGLYASVPDVFEEFNACQSARSHLLGEDIIHSAGTSATPKHVVSLSVIECISSCWAALFAR
jgi:hypothetical protein